VLDVFLAAGLGASLLAVSTIAAARWGHVIGGVLSAFPLIALSGFALASVLAVSTHRQHGADALLDLLRGMLGGMAAFVLFCALIGLLVEPAGLATAFVLATAAAVLVQAALGRQAASRAVPGA
jgi:hypothetical protein